MQQKLQHQPHAAFKANHCDNRYSRTQIRAEADAALREIAFVLKMTQKVRQAIEQEQPMTEAALV